MVTASINFNPASASDVQEGIDLLQKLLQTASVASSNKPDLPPIIGAIANKHKYGPNRLGYLVAVAKAGDAGVDINVMMATHFGGSHQKYGGTHSSIEQSWRSLGGLAYAPQLISDTPDGRQVMTPEARDWVIMYAGLEDLVEKTK